MDEESISRLVPPCRPHHHVRKENAIGPNAAVGNSLGSGIEPEPIALRFQAGNEEPGTEQGEKSSAPGSTHDSGPVFRRWRRYASGDSRKWHSVHCFGG